MSNEELINYRVIAGCVIFVSGFILIGWNISNQGKEKTDNAVVQCDVVDVTSQVRGIVENIYFSDDEKVAKGQALVKLESNQYEAELKRAESLRNSAELAFRAAKENESLTEIIVKSDTARSTDTLAASMSNIEALKSSADEAKSSLKSARASFRLAKSNFNRTEELYKKDVVSEFESEMRKVEYQQQIQAVDAAKIRVDTIEKQILSELSKVAELEKALLANQESEKPSLSKSKVETAIAKSQLDLAEVEKDIAKQNLERTVLKARRTGVVSNRNIGPGQLIEVGQPVASIITCSEEAWIIANYKETQVGDMEIGQKVKFKVDSYVGVEFTGEVESLSAGSGATFSLLPPENATGNFTKVVQRIPVKIKILDDQDKVLRVGMSVVSTVFTNELAE